MFHCSRGAGMWTSQGRAVLFSIPLFFLLLPDILASSSFGGRKRIPSFNPNPPPKFRVYQDDPNFPDPVVTGGRLRLAWIDMWHIATVACLTLDENEEVYERYFEPGESEMVRSIFCNVAGIEDPTICDVSAMSLVVNVHMQDLTIIAGCASPDEVPLSEQPDLNNPDLDIFCTTFQDKGPEEKNAYTQVYKRAFDFPSLDDIFNKRTCAGLGQYDSGLMTSLGAHLLHEMIHWRLLVRASNNQERFDAVIPHKVLLPDPDNEDELGEEEHDYIDDYDKNQYEDPDLDPVTGYGPTSAHELVINGNDASFQNADNYRWYAVSKYWSWKCTQAAAGRRVVFGQQDNNHLGDAQIPANCNGQIPCP